MADIATLSMKVDATQVKEGTKAVDELGRSGEKTESSIAGMTAKVAVASAAIVATVAVIKKSVDAATEYQNALNGLGSVARYAGEDVGATLRQALDLTNDGLLSTTESATALKNLLSRGFTTEQAIDMINRFKDSAAFGRQASLEFGQAVVSATEGIKNENSVLVDNAGVTKNVSVMHKEYAAQLGKSVANLTLAEKRQAEYNGILKETEAQAGNAALAAQGMDGATARLNKTINDAAVTIGQSFTPAAIAITNLLGDGFKTAMDIGVRPMLFMFENLGITVGQFAAELGATLDLISSPSKWNAAGVDAFGKQLAEFQRIAEEMRVSAAGRISGTTPIAQGTDTGRRRQEQIVTPDDTKTLKEYAAALKEANAILADISIQEKANQEWQKLLDLQKKLGDQFPLTAEQMGQAYAKAMESSVNHTEKTASQMSKIWDNFVENTQRALGDTLFNGMTGKFTDIGQAFKEMLLRMAADAAAANIMNAMFGTASTTGGSRSGGIWGTIIGAIAGARAEGGPVNSGSTYLVGERGPELFTPSTSGAIIPNGATGGGTVINMGNTTINVDSRADRQQVLSDVSRLIDTRQNQLVDRLQRTGQLA